MTIAMGSSKTRPIRLRTGSLRRGRNAGLRPATGFDRIIICVRFVPRQHRRKTAAPLQFQARKEHQQGRHRAGINHRIKTKADGANDFAPHAG